MTHLLLFAGLILWFVAGFALALILGPWLERRTPLPPRVGDDELFCRSVELDAEARRRLVQ
jgi:hypothetical protein